MRKRLRNNKVEVEHIIPPVDTPAMVFWRLKCISAPYPVFVCSRDHGPFLTLLPRTIPTSLPIHVPGWPPSRRPGQADPDWVWGDERQHIVTQGKWWLREWGGSGHGAWDACHPICDVSRLASECLAPSFSRLWSLEKERPGDIGGVSADGWPTKVRPVASWSTDTLASLCLAHLLLGTERLCSAIHHGAQKAFWNPEPEHLCPSAVCVGCFCHIGDESH